MPPPIHTQKRINHGVQSERWQKTAGGRGVAGGATTGNGVWEEIFFVEFQVKMQGFMHFYCEKPVAVLGKNIWGPGPSSFGRQQLLSKITIEPIKIWGPGQDLGRPVLCPWPQHKTATAKNYTCGQICPETVNRVHNRPPGKLAMYKTQGGLKI